MRKLVLLLSITLSAETAYEIRRAPSKIVVDGKLDEAAWRKASPMSPWHFGWFKEGVKEPTESKMLWDDRYLYVAYRIHDKHISAYETRRHGPVSKDDCVEIFIAPDPEKVKNYYTFEINAIGTMLNRNKADWWTGPPTWEPEGVLHKTSFHGAPSKEESAEDKEWIVEMAIPLKNFERDAAHTPPKRGDVWRLNLNRTGGKTNSQWSSWAPIPTPRPAFHTPEAFGHVTFME